MFNQYFSFFLRSPQIEALENALEAFVVHQALIAPFLLLFIEESGIPLPVPGDIYLAFIGYQISKGAIPYWMAFIMLLISVLGGSSILYYVSSKWGKKIVTKLGMYMHVDQKRLNDIEKYFKKYGIFLIIFGRHVPGFRIPITIFSGISGVPYRTFLLGTFISIVFWIAFYLALGARLGNTVLRHFHATPVYFLIFIIPIVLSLGWIVYVKLKKGRTKKS